MTTGDEVSFGGQSPEPCQLSGTSDVSGDSDGSAELEAQTMLEEALDQSKLAQKSICSLEAGIGTMKPVKE